MREAELFLPQTENIQLLKVGHGRSDHDGDDGDDRSKGEEPKVAILKDRGLISLRHLLHVMPTLITAAVLGLNFSSIYFVDLGYPNLNVILKAFQFAAKFHELLLAASLSAIVLHHIRYELCDRGIPFGLVASGFQLGDVRHLFTSQFWSAAFAKQGVKWNVLRPLPLLILGAISLSVVAGPSSAIALIPELDWWRFGDPFNKTVGSVLIGVQGGNLYPSLVNAELVRVCVSGTSVKGTCPNSSLEDIQAWVRSYSVQLTSPNISLVDSGVSLRYLTATDNNVTGSWSAATTAPVRIATTMVEMYKYALSQNMKLAAVARPLLLPSMLGKHICKPLVQVQCGEVFNASQITTITFPHDQLKGFNSSLDRWEITSPGLSFTKGEISFEWVDISDVAGTDKVTGAVFGLPGWVNESRSPVWIANASIACSIAADWVPVKPWLDPVSSNTIQQDNPDPLAVVQNERYELTRTPISIGKDWAKILNGMPAGEEGAYIEHSNVTNMAAIASEFGEFARITYMNSLQDAFLVQGAFSASYQWGFATFIAMQVADGLARTGSDAAAYVLNYSAQTNNYSMVWLDEAELSQLEHLGSMVLGSDEYHDRSAWAEIDWEVLRYGYSWGFRGATFYFAATILLIHAVLAIAHLSIALARQWTTKSWGTMGEVIALAVNSPPTEKLRGTGAGVSKGATWKQIVRIREIDGTRLALEFEDGDGVAKPALGRKYA